ncbi:uncharacterized protein LOC135692305 [Rhopilema esculentum]|uniref:uncharacterized protein LOC135692305 n=1 Tax=Rhopilema esculentum TaxID=499914 RepID=UPI0031DDE33C|eukprot:gene9629-17388_t
MEKITLPGFSPYYGPTAGFSRAFQTFIKDIGDAKSKYEEDRIMLREINYLKEHLERPNIQQKQMKENLIRMIYCEMLGHDASFGFIHAVNYTQKGNLMDKRLGYLACCLLLHENHELTLLVMNTIQKDLKSSNIMENCIALIAASRLVNSDMIPALLPLVFKLLQHKRDIVRKKAVMTLLWFYRLDPQSLDSSVSVFELTLCDRSPSVMGATLNVYLELINVSPASYKRFTPTFVNILKQVIEYRLPNEFTYYNVPGPWIQIKLLKILAALGRNDQKTSADMFEILKQCLETTHTDNNIGCAVLFECLRTSVTIIPNKALTELASRRVGLLLVSRNNNLKYLGINILADLIDVDLSYAARHQMAVIECLNDPDQTLKRKTLLLLYRMTNSSNVTVICDKMIDYLRHSVDEYVRSDLVNRVTALAEKFAPDNEWFIETMNTVFELGGSLVRPQVAHNLMMLIGEGTDDDDLDNELRLHAVNSYLDLIDKDTIPDILTQVVCWVIGEYSYLATHCDPEDVLEKLCNLLRRNSRDGSINSWIVTSIAKICAQIGFLPDKTREELEKQLASSSNSETKQRCAELFGLFDIFQSLEDVLPPDASCEDLEVDSTLSFLDEFVADALAQGAAPYKPEHLRQIPTSNILTAEKHEKGLNLTPYPEYKPRKGASRHSFDHPIVTESQPSGINSSVGGMILPTDLSTPAVLNKQKAAKVVWGLSGYLGNKDRDNSADQMSDSSSTNSGADSGSYASITNQRQENPSTESTPNQTLTQQPSDNVKLAEQLFASSPGPSGDRVRPDKAGFSGRRRLDKRSRESKLIAGPKQSNESKQNPIMLLDLDDTNAADLCEPEHINASEAIEKCERDLLDSLYEEIPQMTLNEEVTIESRGYEMIEDSSSFPDVREASLITQEASISSNGDELIPVQIPDDVISQTVQPTDYNVNQRNEDEDLFASIEPSTVSAPAQIPIRSTPSLPEDLKDNLHSEIQVTCEDSNLKLSQQKVFLPDSLIIVLYVMNQRPTALRDVLLFLQPPSNLSITIDGALDTTCSDELIENYEHARHTLRFVYGSPSLHMVLGGHLSYKDASNTQKRLFLNLPLTIFDFVRPLKIDTPTYGRMWEGTAYEKKQQTETERKFTISEICEHVQQKFNFHVVEIIGSEAITAGRINKEHCLLHFKYAHPVLDFRLKTGSNLLNDCILNGISKSL